MKRFSELDAKRAITNAEANMAVEGIRLSTTEKKLIHLKLTGKISEVEFKSRVLELVHSVTV